MESFVSECVSVDSPISGNLLLRLLASTGYMGQMREINWQKSLREKNQLIIFIFFPKTQFTNKKKVSDQIISKTNNVCSKSA